MVIAHHAGLIYWNAFSECHTLSWVILNEVKVRQSVFGINQVAFGVNITLLELCSTLGLVIGPKYTCVSLSACWC